MFGIYTLCQILLTGFKIQNMYSTIFCLSFDPWNVLIAKTIFEAIFPWVTQFSASEWRLGKGVEKKSPWVMAFYYFCTFWLLLTLYCWTLNIPHSFLRIELLIQQSNDKYLFYLDTRAYSLLFCLNEILMSFICKTKAIPKGALYIFTLKCVFSIQTFFQIRNSLLNTFFFQKERNKL